MNSGTFTKLIIAAMLLMLAAGPALADDQPNLCFEPEYKSHYPVDRITFAALKAACSEGDQDAWTAGWNCHPTNQATEFCKALARPKPESPDDPPAITELDLNAPVERREEARREAQPQLGAAGTITGYMPRVTHCVRTNPGPNAYGSTCYWEPAGDPDNYVPDTRPDAQPGDTRCWIFDRINEEHHDSVALAMDEMLANSIALGISNVDPCPARPG